MLRSFLITSNKIKIQTAPGTMPQTPRGGLSLDFIRAIFWKESLGGVLAGAIEKNDTLDKGIKFYINNFFTEDQTPRYFLPQHSRSMVKTLHRRYKRYISF